MEFQKERVYTALNADELRAGDKVIVANTINALRQRVQKAERVWTIKQINPEDCEYRFETNDRINSLAYLVEMGENCTNCEYSNLHNNLLYCDDDKIPIIIGGEKLSVCSKYNPKTTEINTKLNLCSSCKHSFAECPATINDIIFGDGVGNDNVYECTHYKPKTEKKYRPFKDTDELIKVWCDKAKATPPVLDMPYIWVRRKEGNLKGQLITEFSNSLWVEMGKEGYNMTDLLVHFTFLDGSPCGVEE